MNILLYFDYQLGFHLYNYQINLIKDLILLIYQIQINQLMQFFVLQEILN